MKVEHKNRKGFSPIVLSITIETEQELCDLWMRMNASKDHIDHYSGTTLKYNSLPTMSSPLFNELNRLITERNLLREV